MALVDVVNENIDSFGTTVFLLSNESDERYADLFKGKGATSGERLGIFFLRDPEILANNLIPYYSAGFAEIVVYDIPIVNEMMRLYAEGGGFNDSRVRYVDLGETNATSLKNINNHFDKIIMNPPYDGSLHLKILNEVIKENPEAEIINLSPIRWLQDPIAKLKKSSDLLRFEKSIVAKMTSLDVVSSKDSNSMFNIDYGDLGVYYITPAGGWDYSSFNKGLSSYTEKILKKAAKLSFKDVATPEHWRGEYNGIFGVINSHLGGDGHGGLSSFISNNWELFTKARYTSTNMVLFFDTGEERRRCFDFLNSRFMCLYAKNIRQNNRVPWQFVPYLDFSHDWTDEDLYTFFGFTEDEITAIEAEEATIVA